MSDDSKPTIRGDLPMAINTLMLAPEREILSKPATPGSRAFGSAEVALSAMGDALATMVDTKRYVYENAKPTGEKVMIPGMGTAYQVNGQEESLREAMSRSFSRAAEITDRQRTAIEKSIAEIETAIEGKLCNPQADKVSVSQVASEIREHIKSMKSAGDRANFFRTAVMDGDLETVSAVLNASPFVSGFDRKQHAELRALAAEQFPATRDDYAQLRATKTVLQKVETAGAAFVSKYSELLPPDLKGGRQGAAAAIAALAAGKS